MEGLILLLSFLRQNKKFQYLSIMSYVFYKWKISFFREKDIYYEAKKQLMTFFGPTRRNGGPTGGRGGQIGDLSCRVFAIVVFIFTHRTTRQNQTG